MSYLLMPVTNVALQFVFQEELLAWGVGRRFCDIRHKC